LGSLVVSARQGAQRGQLGHGLAAPARPDQRVAQQPPRLETTAGGRRRSSDPLGQRGIPQLGSLTCGVGEHHRIQLQIGVQHQHRLAQDVIGPPPTGVTQHRCDPTAQPPGMQPAHLCPLYLTVEWVS
jgi:hypothetical protein